MTPEEMRTLYDYNAWANHRSLDAAANLTSEQFTKPVSYTHLTLPTNREV